MNIDYAEFNIVRNILVAGSPSFAIHRIYISEYNTLWDMDLLLEKLKHIPIDTSLDIYNEDNIFRSFEFKIKLKTGGVLYGKDIISEDPELIKITLEDNIPIFVFDEGDIIEMVLYAEIGVPPHDKYKVCSSCYLENNNINIITAKINNLKTNIKYALDGTKYSIIKQGYGMMAKIIYYFNSILHSQNLKNLIFFSRPILPDSHRRIDFKSIMINHMFSLWVIINTYYLVKYDDKTKIDTSIKLLELNNINMAKIINIEPLLKIICSLIISPYILEIPSNTQTDNRTSLDYSRTDGLEIVLKDQLNDFGYKDMLVKSGFDNIIKEVNALTEIMGDRFKSKKIRLKETDLAIIKFDISRYGFYNPLTNIELWR